MISQVSNYIRENILVLFSVLVLFCLCASCSFFYKKQKVYKVGFSQCIGEHDWRKAMEREMLREMFFHDDMELEILDAEGNIATQQEQIRQLISQNVDILIISALEAEPLANLVELANEKAIPTILLDRKVNTEQFTSFIGADNYEIGHRAGAYVKERFPNANILEIRGLKGSSPAIERHNGFHDGIKGSNAIILKEIQLELENENFSIDSTPLLDNLDSIDLIFGHTDAIAFNSFKIIERSQAMQPIKYIGIDGLFGENLGIDLVDKGILEATFLYPTGGKEAIRLAKKILNGEAFEKNNSLVSTKIDSSNIELIKFQEQKISEQQSNIELQHQIIRMNAKLNARQQNTIVLMLFISIVILILSALLYFSLEQKKKKNLELIKLNNEISLQKAQIEEVSEQVKELTEEKIRYFISISHEFRTPLTLMLTPLKEMLKSEDHRTEFNLKLIKKNSIRLHRLINQLMDFRKIEFNQMKIVVNEIGIEDFVSELVLHFSHLAKSKSIVFELNSFLKTAFLWGDKNLLDKVIFNLLSNAFKFTPVGGRIEIDLEENEEAFLLKVKNTGPRISTANAERIFERYYTQGHQTGIGIGLSLSKEFVQLHGGTIMVDQFDHQFTTFLVSLPKGKDHFPEHTIFVTEDVQVIREDNDAFFELDSILTINQPKDEVLPEVLVIEDNIDLTNYLSNALSHQFNISVANSGREGLDMAYKNIPDVIICDIQMMYVDGFKILHQLKQDVKTSHIPIIMLTASQVEENKLIALKKGADAYITKPFNLELLVESIRGQLLNRSLLKQYYSQLFGIGDIQSDVDIQFINSFKSIVLDNLDNSEFTVEHVYKKLGLSRIQLYRKVKAILGCGVHDYIVECRIKEAQRLLAIKDISIKEIAYKTGFTSQSYFSTIFKSKVKLTPSEYRNKL